MATEHAIRYEAKALTVFFDRHARYVVVMSLVLSGKQEKPLLKKVKMAILYGVLTNAR